MILNKKIEAPSQMSLPPASAPQQLADEAASDPPSPEGLPEDGMELEAEVERSEPLTVSARGGSKMSTESEELVPDAAMQARSADQAEQAGDVASGLAENPRPSKSSRVAMFLRLDLWKWPLSAALERRTTTMRMRAWMGPLRM